MKGVQCYELFGGIALKNHAFSLTKTANIRKFSLKRRTIPKQITSEPRRQRIVIEDKERDCPVVIIVGDSHSKQ